MMKKDVWKKIPDARVQHVWKKAEDDNCGEGPETVVVSPSWYEENGTPICFCGEDMVYSHTEILTPSKVRLVKEKLQHVRDMLYQVNAVNISMYMLGMKKRDDKLVADTNECLGEILKQLDELIQETKQGMGVL